MDTKQTVLLVGRTRMVIDAVHDQLDVKSVNLLAATNLEEVKEAFNRTTIDKVIMGAGIELEARLGIVRHAFEASRTTTVHLKDELYGPKGFIPFVNSILR